MSEWITPKTNWSYSYDENGAYTGDTFEPADFNRIKNNIIYLKDLMQSLYAEKIIFNDSILDVYYGQENGLFASEMEAIQNNLESINNNSLQLAVGSKEIYTSNAAGKLVDELNRIEMSSHKLFTLLTNQKNNTTKLPFRLGNWKGVRT
ncbi:MAG: hypothetical protein PHX08_01765 [Lachnospiraceae bacterium]|nr:hypothetical protein [Lachnospiraceae bacterium]